MAELQEALKYLGPSDWAEIPQQQEQLDAYLADLFDKAQLIVDSVPIPDPTDAPKPPRQQLHNNARKAAEVSLSAERSAPAPFGNEKFRKEWGKQFKVKQQENPLGVSIYKMSGKDGRGAWFARSAVHEGIGFDKIKRSMQYEFEKSMAEKGPPGTGNVRGIGGEERVEDITASNRGRVEVYHLSAQFPGPVAARDFVSLLITSSKAMKEEHKLDSGKAHSLTPRHYMVISKPCNHPKTQPSSSFVRGSYESIEFIREVPRKLKQSQSSVDLTNGSSKPKKSIDGSAHDHKDVHDHDEQHRPRSATASAAHLDTNRESYNPEDNPVEWIMITRSDPGGGIPRFLVDRGTPGSICGDVVKFLDWACQNDDLSHDHHDENAGIVKEVSNPRPPHQSWRSRSLVGIAEDEQNLALANANVAASSDVSPEASARHSPTITAVKDDQAQHGILGSVVQSAAGIAATAAAAVRPYAPNVVLNHLPEQASSQLNVAGEEAAARPGISQQTTRTEPFPGVDDDAKSIASATSYASAEDFISSEDDASVKSGSPSSKSKDSGHHEKELERLAKRKETLHERFSATRAKQAESHQKQLERDQNMNQKAIEKHEKELKKHEEKYQRELQKIEQKQEKERKKQELKRQKQLDKDDKYRLTRERDEAREELGIVKKEAESLRHLVQELQRENTALAIKIGRAGLTVDKEIKPSGESRSRNSSLSRRDKSHSNGDAGASIKSI